MIHHQIKGVFCVVHILCVELGSLIIFAALIANIYWLVDTVYDAKI